MIERFPKFVFDLKKNKNFENKIDFNFRNALFWLFDEKPKKYIVTK